MVGDIIGLVLVKQSPEFSQNLFGDLSEIAGKTLNVLEKNSEGDFLCLGPGGKYLVDIDNKDVSLYTPIPQENKLEHLIQHLSEILSSRG